MNSSAEKARRKWPSGGRSRARPAKMVTTVTALALLCVLTAPAAAARRHAAWPLAPWGDLSGDHRRPKLRRAALPPSVPLPKPRPAEAPVTPPDKPKLTKQTPAETKPAEQAAPAPPPPSTCRLALTEEIAIAPSIPDIHGAGGCGGEDLVRLEAVGLPDKRRVSVKPAAILRCPRASAIADCIRTPNAP